MGRCLPCQNDDGSAYYHTHSNFFVYSDGGLKNDFGGHDNHHHDNLYAYTGKVLNVCDQIAGHEDWFIANKAIMTKANASLGKYNCALPPGQGRLVIHSNQVFTPDGTAAWACGPPEPNSTVELLPPAEEVVGWAREALLLD